MLKKHRGRKSGNSDKPALQWAIPPTECDHNSETGRSSLVLDCAGMLTETLGCTLGSCIASRSSTHASYVWQKNLQPSVEGRFVGTSLVSKVATLVQHSYAVIPSPALRCREKSAPVLLAQVEVTLRLRRNMEGWYASVPWVLAFDLSTEGSNCSSRSILARARHVVKCTVHYARPKINSFESAHT